MLPLRSAKGVTMLREVPHTRESAHLRFDILVTHRRGHGIASEWFAKLLVQHYFYKCRLITFHLPFDRTSKSTLQLFDCGNLNTHKSACLGHFSILHTLVQFSAD